jgi:formylmethanofuran dehydrogenase subunit E
MLCIKEEAIMNEQFDEIARFHGHKCPGLAMGYRMTTAAMKLLAESSAEDEELVAIVENDACGVDALQWLTGCTFGKGNFIFKDYGKQVYTLYSRNSGKGVRTHFKDGAVPQEMRASREGMMNWILDADEKDVVEVKEVTLEPPPKAQMHKSVKCDSCGEYAMDTRIRQADGKNQCIPCAQQQ